MERTIVRENLVLPKEVLMALAALKGHQQTLLGKQQTVYDLTDHVLDLRDKNIDIRKVSLSLGFSGYWSEDIAKLITVSEALGDLQQREDETITFNGEGFKKMCEMGIAAHAADHPELRELITEAKKALDLV